VTLNPILKPGVIQAARKCVQHFGHFLADQKLGMFTGVSAALGLTLCELLRPWPVKIVIDYILIPVGDQSGYAIIRDLSPEHLLWCAASAMLLIPLFLGIFNSISQIALAQVGRKVTTRVRCLVCEHLQLLPLSFHHDAKVGDLLVRMMGDVNMVRDILFSGWVSMVQRSLLFIATLCLLIWFSPTVGLLALAPLPLLMWSIRRSGGRMKDAVSKQRRKEGSAAALASELLVQIRGIKAFGAERRSAKIFGGLSRSGERAGVKATRIAAGASLQAEIATGAGLALVLFFGVGQVMDDAMSAGTLIMLLSYVRALHKPLRKLSRDGIRLAKAAACAERLFEVLELPAESSVGESKAPRFSGKIEFADVTHTYGGRDPALEDFSLTIEAGTLCVLKGRNGAGKSTTLSLLLRLYKPLKGEILIDGEAAEKFDLESWRAQFAYVPQENLLFAGTLADNVLFGRPDASPEDLQASIDSVGLAPLVQELPDGLDTEIGEAGNKLSGGQRRLVSLARASLRSASILLLDEPIEGLDASARLYVAKAIREIAQGRTTIVVSHAGVDEIKPDLIAELRNGCLVEAPK
jgi:ATP-binding cassette subfamily B protein